MLLEGGKGETCRVCGKRDMGASCMGRVSRKKEETGVASCGRLGGRGEGLDKGRR